MLLKVVSLSRRKRWCQSQGFIHWWGKHATNIFNSAFFFSAVYFTSSWKRNSPLQSNYSTHNHNDHQVYSGASYCGAFPICLCYQKKSVPVTKTWHFGGLGSVHLCFQPPSCAAFLRRTGEGKKGWFSGTLLAEVPFAVSAPKNYNQL